MPGERSPSSSGRRAPGEPSRVSGVRPYLITGGRSSAVGALPPEAQVISTSDGRTAAARLNYEHRDVVVLCARPYAVAEIAAHLRLHLGVVRVLVADLVAMGYLAVRRPDAVPAASVIERVIRGITAIR